MHLSASHSGNFSSPNLLSNVDLPDPDGPTMSPMLKDPHMLGISGTVNSETPSKAYSNASDSDLVISSCCTGECDILETKDRCQIRFTEGRWFEDLTSLTITDDNVVSELRHIGTLDFFPDVIEVNT